jgi:DNA adenine methylase
MSTAQTLFELPGDGGASSKRTRGRGAHITPLLKWPGGKGSELAKILPSLPNDFDRYFEPFVGGGAVYFAMPSERPAFINDASTDLMSFYSYVQKQDEGLFDYLEAMERWWVAIAAFTDAHAADLVETFRGRRSATADVELRTRHLVKSVLGELANTVPEPWADLEAAFIAHARDLVPKKLVRMWAVQAQRGVDLPEADVWGNLEGAFKAACYTTLRSAYNVSRGEGSTGARHAALFFFLREYAYAAMFRFNASGEFNVPYGGMTYNRKDFAGKIDHLRAPAVIERLVSTTLFCEDFEAFLGVHSPTVNDFVFLDPPYDSDFSDYDRNSFGRRDHARLAAQMADLSCRFQLVIKSTPAVLDIYANESWNVLAFDKKYMWTIKERNDRDATHLMITNYAPEPTKAGSWGGPR